MVTHEQTTPEGRPTLKDCNHSGNAAGEGPREVASILARALLDCWLDERTANSPKPRQTGQRSTRSP